MTQELEIFPSQPRNRDSATLCTVLALLCLCTRFEAESGSNVAVLVTAPKDPLFLVKSESTERLRRLRQIRVLVFSDKNIVKVSLDGSEKGGSA